MRASAAHRYLYRFACADHYGLCRYHPLTTPRLRINQKLTPDEKIGLLREMLRIRRFEQQALKQYNGSKMGGFLHLYIGQETVAVGTCSLMGDHDHVITAYR